MPRLTLEAIGRGSAGCGAGCVCQPQTQGPEPRFLVGRMGLWHCRILELCPIVIQTLLKGTQTPS